MTLHEGVAHYRETAQKIWAHPAVSEVHVRTDDNRRRGAFVEFEVDADRIPPGVETTLGECDVGLFSVDEQAGGAWTVALAQ
jgi:hypothetical protein